MPLPTAAADLAGPAGSVGQPGTVPPRAHYARQLDELQDDVLTLGSMVDKAIDRATEALATRDFFLARRVIREDLDIDRRRFEIEQRVLLLITTQQPIASDLRFLASVLFIIVDLERMGDHARSIGRLAIRIGSEGQEVPLGPLPQVTQLAALVRDRLRRSLDAFVRRDCAAAIQVAAEDARTDELQDAVYTEMLGIMISDPATVPVATYVVWVAHNFERIGDHVTNICERVVFTVTGRMQEFRVTKREL